MNSIIFIDGYSRKKTCFSCKRFWHWGSIGGTCCRTNKMMLLEEHCKYYKRDAELFMKDGKQKTNHKKPS